MINNQDNFIVHEQKFPRLSLFFFSKQFANTIFVYTL